MRKLFVIPVSRALPFVMLLMLACLSALPVNADEALGLFKVVSAKVSPVEGEYSLSAQLNIRLCRGAQEALENGVPLVIGMQVQIYQANTWIWDQIVKEFRIERQLQYHALSRRYLVRDLALNELLSFARLEDAIHELGRVVDEPVTGLMEAVEDDEKYFVRLRGFMDIEALPTPVRLMAYMSSEWDVDSEWYTWPLSR